MRIAAACALLVALIVLLVAWRATPLADLFDPGVVMRYRDRAHDLPFAPLVVVALFVAGGFVAAPGTLMIGATALLFGAARGSLYSFIGMLVNGSVIYALARYAARGAVDAWLAARGGSPLDVLNRGLERRGFIAIVLMRLTPVPYTVQNIVAGTARIRFADFILGTSIGILPVIALMAGIASRFDAWLADPDWTKLALLAGAVAGAVAVIWLVKRWADGQRVER